MAKSKPMGIYELRIWRKILLFLLGLGVFTLLALLFFDYTQKQKSKELQITYGSEQTSITEEIEVQSIENSEVNETTTLTSSSTISLIPVYVSGAVKQPLLCYLPADALWQDAVEAAGGLTEDAAAPYINMAAPISMHQMIYIPSLSEWESGQSAPAAYPIVLAPNANTAAYPEQNQALDQGKISINLADAASLTQIPGVGEKTAALIINYRESNGPFETIEDLMKIPGIKEAKFAQMRDYITVDK